MKDNDCRTKPRARTTGTPGDRTGPSLDTLDSLVGRWFVHVIVCGIYTGAYKFDTEEQAQADAADRRRKFGVLGCRYIVAPNAEAHASATKEP